MVLLKSDQFISELSRLFILARNTGAISLVLKRYNGQDRHVPKDGSKPVPDPEEFMCLVRVTYKSKKISTVINSSEVDKFQQAYCSLLRNNMDGLKKIKKLRTKTKAKQ